MMSIVDIPVPDNSEVGMTKEVKVATIATIRRRKKVTMMTTKVTGRQVNYFLLLMFYCRNSFDVYELQC